MENQTPTPTQITETPQVVQEILEVDTVQPRNNFLTILLSILLFISVAIAGFFAFQTQKLVKELTMLKTEPVITAEPIVEQTQRPVATVDPTANWKTYTGSDFIFKYPTTISVNKKSQGKEDIFEIKGLEKDIVLVVDPITDHNFYLGKQISSVTKYNNISWSVLTGDQKYCDGGECGEISDALQVEYQNKRYSIVLGDLVYPDTVLDQILATFKFTN